MYTLLLHFFPILMEEGCHLSIAKQQSLRASLVFHSPPCSACTRGKRASY